MCDVSGEVSIFVAFLSVSCVNVPLSWTGEFIQVDYFLVVVNDHNVWLLRSHTELRRDRTPPGAVCPGKSLYTVYFSSIDFTI